MTGLHINTSGPVRVEEGEGMGDEAFVNAVIEVNIPLGEVSVDDDPFVKQEALGRVMEELCDALPDSLAEAVSAGRWEDLRPDAPPASAGQVIRLRLDQPGSLAALLAGHAAQFIQLVENSDGTYGLQAMVGRDTRERFGLKTMDEEMPRVPELTEREADALACVRAVVLRNGGSAAHVFDVCSEAMTDREREALADRLEALALGEWPAERRAA